MNRRDQRQAKKRKEREERHRQKKHEQRVASARDPEETHPAVAKCLANLRQREEAYASSRIPPEDRPAELLNFAYDQALRIVSHRLGREAALGEPETTQFINEADATRDEIAGADESRESAALMTAEYAWQIAALDEESALELAIEAIAKDDRCFLALGLAGNLEAENAREAITNIQKACELAESSLGSSFFEEHQGEFSRIRRGRAYLRLLRLLTYLCLVEGEVHSAAETIAKLHAADKDGHFGAYHFGAVQALLAANPDVETLERIREQLEPQKSPIEAWLLCALEFKFGNHQHAQELVMRAHMLNPYFSHLWLGVVPEEVEALGDDAPYDFDFSEAIEMFRIVHPLAARLEGFESWCWEELFGDVIS